MNCKYCNSITLTKRSEVCKECTDWKKYIILYKKVGMYNSNKTFKENNEISLKILYEIYFIQKLSTVDIRKIYNINLNSLYNYFKKNNLSLRTVSEATTNSIYNGTWSISSGNYHKHGWHTTWDNKQVYYRSSYELKFAKKLDNKKIPYEMEFKRFLYWNTKNKKWQVAIPDFYLPLENKIIEIKSNYFLNESEMNDKIKEYKNQGYDFELKILD